MIQIDNDLYAVDLHLTDAEAGILLETAFDLMESRGQRGKAQEENAPAPALTQKELELLTKAYNEGYRWIARASYNDEVCAYETRPELSLFSQSVEVEYFPKNLFQSIEAADFEPVKIKDLLISASQKEQEVEIEPEAFAGTITINDAANSAFDKSELVLVGRMTHLIRFADIIPDLTARAVYRNELKSIELTANFNHTVIEIPEHLDKLGILRRMIEAVQVMRVQE